MGFDEIKYERRTRISKEKTDMLKNIFVKRPYLLKKEKRNISELINVPVSFINNWFQNMRAYVRKRLNYTKHGFINKCSRLDPEDVFHPENCDLSMIYEVVFM